MGVSRVPVQNGVQLPAVSRGCTFGSLKFYSNWKITDPGVVGAISPLKCAPCWKMVSYQKKSKPQRKSQRNIFSYIKSSSPVSVSLARISALFAPGPPCPLHHGISRRRTKNSFPFSPSEELFHLHIFCLWRLRFVRLNFQLLAKFSHFKFVGLLLVLRFFCSYHFLLPFNKSFFVFLGDVPETSSGNLP